jgi:hypothetical protein
LHLKLLKHSRSLTAANEFYSIFKWPNYGEAYIASAFPSVCACRADILICKLWSCADLCGLQMCMAAKVRLILRLFLSKFVLRLNVLRPIFFLIAKKLIQSSQLFFSSHLSLYTNSQITQLMKSAR